MQFHTVAGAVGKHAPGVTDRANTTPRKQKAGKGQRGNLAALTRKQARPAIEGNGMKAKGLISNQMAKKSGKPPRLSGLLA